MIISNDGEITIGFPQFVSADLWPVPYEGHSGEQVFHVGDAYGEEPLGYDLPASHILSFVHDRSKCYYCGLPFAEGSLCLEHIVPKKKGGSHRVKDFSRTDNVTTACDDCNREKWMQLGWKTLDGRYGFFCDGTPGYAPNAFSGGV